MILDQHKPTAQHQRSMRSVAHKEGKEATHNSTTAPTRHPLPGRRQNTTHVPHDTPTHRPSHPPSYQPTHHATAAQQQTDALLRTRTLPEQADHTAERTKCCCCTKHTNSSTSHRHENTHPRTKRSPPTHPTFQLLANRSTHPTTKHSNQCATAAQQYSSTYQLERTTAHRGDWYVHDFYLESSIMGTLHLQRSTVTC